VVIDSTQSIPDVRLALLAALERVI
jgi:hypothetical protein